MFACVVSLNAQSTDTTNRINRWLGDPPRKATLLSAMIPGAGQVYNRSYWKLPILYGGFGGLIYALSFNQGEYKRFSEYYRFATDDDPLTISPFPGAPEQLRQRRNYYKKNRDLSIIGMAGLYALQILDAHIEAHLNSFNISDDLSLHWSPMYQPGYFSTGNISGLRIQMFF